MNKNNQKNKLKAGIRNKFLVILIILFGLFAGNFLITLHIVNTQKHDALLINLAGRQRMLSQRIMSLTNHAQFEKAWLLGQNSSYSHTYSHHKEIKNTSTLFHITMHSFLDGGQTFDSEGQPVNVEQITKPETVKSLYEAHLKWHVFINKVEESLKNEFFLKKDMETSVNIFYEIEDIKLLKALDTVVTMLEKEAGARIIQLRTIQTISLLLCFVLFFIVIVFLNKTILKPVNELVSTVKGVGAGDISKRNKITSNDEIGFLAGSFNTMMDNLEQTTVSKDFLENVIKSISESIIVTDRNREIKLINSATIELLGMQNENEIIGSRIDEFATTTGKGNKSLFKPQTFETLLDKGYIRNFNVSYRSVSGELIPVSFSARLLKDASGSFGGLVCVARDMREFNLLQAKLIQSSKLAALGTMSAGMGHELKTPLTVVKGTAQFLISQFENNVIPEKETMIQDMEDIISSTDRAVVIINHLKDFSRVSTDKDWRRLDINDIIKDSLILPNKQLNKSGIHVIIDIEDGLPKIWGEHNKLISVFQNLITNAFDAFELVKDSRKKVISIIARLTDSGELNIIFEDNALGMDQDIIRNIFNPFFTTKDVGRGTGLGLSILYGIIEEHGGKIDVSSTPNKGTVFNILLKAGKQSILTNTE